MRRRPLVRPHSTGWGLRAVILVAATVVAYCVAVPPKPLPPAPSRTPSARSTTPGDPARPDEPYAPSAEATAEPEALDLSADPKVLRRAGCEFPLEGGRAPLIPRWEAGLRPDEVEKRENVEALSKGRLPADWYSVDRSWAEDLAALPPSAPFTGSETAPAVSPWGNWSSLGSGASR